MSEIVSADRRRLLARGTPAPVRMVRRGLLASAIAPLATALALVLVFGFLISFGTSWWTSYSRDQLFSQPVQTDRSIAEVGGGGGLSEAVTVLVHEPDGALRRLVVERDAADAFVNETLRRLDDERAAIKAAAASEVARIFGLAFSDRNQAIERYADWFFAWKRPYVVLKEAVASTATHIIETGEYEPLAIAVERDLKTYFMRNYSEQVLRPEQRDAVIAAAFEDTARRAHERWLRVVAEQDLRLQLFLLEHAEALTGPGEQPLTTLALDWDSQRFKAPTYLMEDKAFDGILSLATVGAGGTIGALVLRPAMERATARMFTGLGRRYASAFAGRLAMTEAGAAAGTVIQPVGGTVIGAVAGGMVGLAADYLLNEAAEAMNREAFVAANQAALDATITLWHESLTASLDAAVDRWFDDTRAAVVATRS